MTKKAWTSYEEDILRQHYWLCDKKQLQTLIPNRTWVAIILHARSIGLKRAKYTSANLDILLEDIPESYYWIGFIMADGTIDHEKYRLRIRLARKEIYHLDALSGLINAPINQKEGGICVQDKIIVPQIIEKFDFKPRKTYNPPQNINWMNNDLFLSFVIGFIDGDGSIRKQSNRNDCKLSIKLHSSWIEFLQNISDRLCKSIKLKPNIAIINNAGYANINFTNSIILKFLKRKSEELKLPILSRKWDLIDLSFVSRQERAKLRFISVKRLKDKGLSYKEISFLLDLKYMTVYNLIRRNS